jgi:beta-carotene/zeaxanthin 4-ketolase
MDAIARHLRRLAADPYARQAAIGLALAAGIIGFWLFIHVNAVFRLDLAVAPLPGIVLLILVQTWLSVGLFIIAHDAMHGSLAPFRPAVNLAVGRLALALYAGFSFDALAPKHFAHHRHPGTAEDPDFDADHPHAIMPWFANFIRQHFGWREFGILCLLVVAYLFVLGAPFANLMLFWALPAMLSAFQLFYFGTYRPHRDDGRPFADEHRARSEDMPEWLSLLTCFHFGLHHEHHDAPHVPWWRLPAHRRRNP